MALHDLAIWIYNLDSSESVEIASICLSKKLSMRHNHSRSFTLEVPAGDTLVTSNFAADSLPALMAGNRKLVVFRDGNVVFHGRVFNVERTGDGTVNRAVVTAFDPLMELGYDSEDRAGRPVRDETGNFISPSFNGDGPISGGDLMFQVLTNTSQAAAAENPGPGAEGPLPILLDIDNFSIDIPPAIDLSTFDAMAWPVLIGDFIQALIATNVVDIYLRPIDPQEYIDDAVDPFCMVAFFAVNEYGGDQSGATHFDYWTGSKNAKAARYVEDFSTINNKLYDYLGPRSTTNTNQWLSNITPGSPGTTVDPTDSRTKYGTFMQIREFDSTGAETDTRPLYIANWNAEQGLRIEPRAMLFITPDPDSKALFEPFDDYNVGDLVAVNVGGEFGVNIAAVQRIYGFDIEWDRNGIERVSELVVSADAT